MDWSLVRGKTEVMSQANAAVKTTCPQSVFPSCYDSEEGTAWDVFLSEANGVALQQQLHCPTLTAMGDCRNGILEMGELFRQSMTAPSVAEKLLSYLQSVACQKCYVCPSGEQITFEYPSFEAMTMLEKYVMYKRR